MKKTLSIGHFNLHSHSFHSQLSNTFLSFKKNLIYKVPYIDNANIWTTKDTWVIREERTKEV